MNQSEVVRFSSYSWHFNHNSKNAWINTWLTAISTHFDPVKSLVFLTIQISHVQSHICIYHSCNWKFTESPSLKLSVNSLSIFWYRVRRLKFYPLPETIRWEISEKVCSIGSISCCGAADITWYQRSLFWYWRLSLVPTNIHSKFEV